MTIWPARFVDFVHSIFSVTICDYFSPLFSMCFALRKQTFDFHWGYTAKNKKNHVEICGFIIKSIGGQGVGHGFQKAIHPASCVEHK